MKKIASTICVLVIILVSVWAIASFIEVISNNLNPYPVYSDWNLFTMSSYDRTADGTYCEDGTIITDDGHIWEYDADLADGTPVRVYFKCKGTDDVTDDVITRLGEYK